MSDADRQRRAEERRQRMTLRKGSLRTSEPDVDVIRGAAAISLATVLSRESWALSGRPEPTYRRDEIPCRFVRRRGK